MQTELEIAVCQSALDVTMRFPLAIVPYHYGATAILSLGDGSLKSSVLNRMIFHLHCQPLVAGEVTRSFRYSPALEHPAPTEAEVVMQLPGCMLLYHERKSGCLGFGLDRVASAWFPGNIKVAHGAVTLKLPLDDL